MPKAFVIDYARCIGCHGPAYCQDEAELPGGLDPAGFAAQEEIH